MNDNNGNAYNDFFTAGEISEYLRIPLNTIYRLTKQGAIKGVKVGKQWRYNKGDVEKVLSGEIERKNAHLNEYEGRSERRSYPRINCNFKCRSEISISDMKEICFADGYVINISAGGVCISFKDNCCFELVKIGDPIKVDFDLISDLDSSVHSINTKGRIVWTASNGAGVKFRHIDEKYKKLITDYVD